MAVHGRYALRVGVDAIQQPAAEYLGEYFLVVFYGLPEGSGPYSEVVQYRDNPWLGRGKPLFHSPVPKISLIYELLNEQRIRY